MKMNLLPKELQPTRPSPVPYTIVFGLVAIGTIWVLTQLTFAGHARYSSQSVRRDCAKALKELAQTKEIPVQLEKAKEEEAALKSKAVVVTMLTKDSKIFSPIIKSIAASTPKSLRLDKITLDPSAESATVTGYGAETNTDTDVATFLIALDNDQTIAKVFEHSRLESSRPCTMGNMPAKMFTINMKYRKLAPKQLEPEVIPGKAARRRRVPKSP